MNGISMEMVWLRLFVFILTFTCVYSNEKWRDSKVDIFDYKLDALDSGYQRRSYINDNIGRTFLNQNNNNHNSNNKRFQPSKWAADAINKLFKKYWNWRLNNDPETATTVGNFKHDDRVRNMTVRSFKQRANKLRGFLRKMKRLKGLVDKKKNPDLALNIRLFEEGLKQYIHGMKYHPYVAPFGQLEGPQTEPITTLKEMKKKTVGDFKNIISRMRAYSIQVDEHISLLTRGIEIGHTMHRVSFEKLIPLLKGFGTEGGNVETNRFFNSFKKQPATIPSDQWNVLVSSAKETIKKYIQPAYTRLARFMETVYIPRSRPSIALSSLPNGRNYYRDILKFYTTTNMTPDEIHRIGKKEVKRINARMVGVMKAVNYSGTLPEFRKYLRTDTKFGFKTGAEILSYYKSLQAKVSRVLPSYFSVMPKTQFVVKEVPASVAATQPAAYYQEPTYKGQGIFFINTYHPQQRRNYEGYALFLHEAIPGHHHQIALQYEHNTPAFRRYTGKGGHYYEAPATYAMDTAYVEGWALYCEYLGEEMGMYSDPYQLFGRLSMEMLRACRLVVDTGMHFFGWTRQQAIDYLKANTAEDMTEIVTEVTRYITMPGQACAYKVGEMEIKKLRKMATKRLGTKFDIRKFHDFLLSLGPVPLNILKEQMKMFIRRQKKM